MDTVIIFQALLVETCSTILVMKPCSINYPCFEGYALGVILSASIVLILAYVAELGGLIDVMLCIDKTYGLVYARLEWLIDC